MSMFRLLLNRPARKGKCTGPSSLRAFWENTSGGVLIYTAIGMAVFLGFAGLAVDISYWYATKRSVQSASDASALAGALELARGTDDATMRIMAKADSAKNGYLEGAGTTITINNPPQSGVYAGDGDAVEATIQQTVPGFLSRVLGVDTITVGARAVAVGFDSDSCLYVLAPSADSALSVTGTAAVEMDCGAQVNSDSPIAIDQIGSSCLTATSIATAGGASGSCVNPTPDENGLQVDDPFEYLSAPSAGPCTETALVEVTSATTLVPGNYCGGIKIEADVTFNPGDYTVGGEGLQIQGNSVVTGDGVNFYFPPTLTGYDKPGPTPPVALYIAGTTDVQLTAGATGPYANMLFYLDPAIDPNLEIWLEGGADMELEGIIYATQNHMLYAGGSDQNDGWLVTLVDTIEFVGNSYMQGPDPSINLPFALVTPTLVE